MDPGTPEKRAEMERRADTVEAEIRSLVTRANAADADLASAIRGAAGQETPAQIYDKLDDGAPPKESRPGEAEPEANRTYNQMKAFEKVFGHAPLSSADWATAAALDPHSYNAKNGGVPPRNRRWQDRTRFLDRAWCGRTSSFRVKTWSTRNRSCRRASTR